MKRVIYLFLLLFVSIAAAAAEESQQNSGVFKWDELPSLPDPIGVAGPFSGVSNGALIVAGGANFSEKQWGEGEKVWHDRIFVLEPGREQWRSGFKLPHPLAYGVSITTDFGLICIGGSDSRKAYKTVLFLEWIDGVIKTTRLPDLPEPRAAAAGALLNNTIFIAGGQTGSVETEVTNTFWKLELPGKKTGENKWENLQWQALEPLPGEPRAQAIAAVQDGRFYLFSGFTLELGSDRNQKRKYLNDAYCYHRKEGWKCIADVPRPAVAAASAISYGESHILVFGGHDGVNDHLISTLKDKWPGFSRDILAYHTITDTWVKMGTMPVGVVTTSAVSWLDKIVIPSGEIRPRIRTNRIFQAAVSPKKASFGALNIALLTIYLVTLVAMGFYFSKREKTTADFFVGDRRVPWWAAGVSIFGTHLSSISFMAIPAKVYATDWTYFVGMVCIVLVQPIIVYFYLPFFRRLNITSAYEYLEKRFNVAVRLIGSLSFIIFQIGRMTIILFLPALALSAVTGINIYICIVVMGVLSTLYTFLGGIEAVIWTDVLQVVVLVGGALMSLVIILLSVEGGTSRIVEMGLADGKFNWFNMGWDFTAPVLCVIFIGGIFQNIVSFSADQSIIQRYLTTRDEKTAAGAIWTNAVMVLPVSCIWFILGTSLYVFYKTHPQLLDLTLKTDQTFPLFIAQQLPDGIVGLVIAGLFAASMSTVDSGLNSTSTVIVTDFYYRIKHTDNDLTCLRLARLLIVILGVVVTCTALWMAANREVMSLWDAYMAVLGLLMGSLAGLFALGIFTRRVKGIGALIGAVGGAVVLFLVQRYTGMHFYMYAAIGITACFVIGYGISLVIPEKGKSTDGLTIYSLAKRKD